MTQWDSPLILRVEVKSLTVFAYSGSRIGGSDNRQRLHSLIFDRNRNGLLLLSNSVLSDTILSRNW